MEIRTARLVLRRARPSDLEAIHAILANPRATAYWSTPPHETLDQSRAWLASMIEAPSESSEDFVIEMDGRVVGKAGFWRLPEIGYILDPGVWGRGVAFEATSAVIAHVFATRPLDRLTADVDPNNQGSIRLLEKLGFRLTGSAERTWLIGDAWVDSLYYDLSRADWDARRPVAAQAQDSAPD